MFTGRAGWGGGIIVLDTNLVVGADAGGGSYDGTYIFNPQTSMLDIDVTVTMAPGTSSVVGATAGTTPMKFPLKLSMPSGTLTGFKHTAQTPMGPIALTLTKIRDFPT